MWESEEWESEEWESAEWEWSGGLRSGRGEVW